MCHCVCLLHTLKVKALSSVLDVLTSIFHGQVYLVLLLLQAAALIVDRSEAAGYPPAGDCAGSLECPPYTVVDSQPEFEIRKYTPRNWVSSQSFRGQFTTSTNAAFLQLFSYIQGNNDQSAKVPMTAPVLINVKPSSYVVSFYLPGAFQTSPPTSSVVTTTKFPSTTFVAVRRFGGFMSQGNTRAEAAALKNSLRGTQWESKTAAFSPNEFMLFGYNSPFEVVNRVNEVMFGFD